VSDEVEVRERLSRLEEWAVHADKRMDQLTAVTERLVNGLRWVTIIIAMFSALLFGDKLFPLITAFAGR